MGKKSHPFFCDCNRCRKERFPLTYAAEQKQRKRSSGNFSQSRPDGTTIYGPKSTEGRPGHKHGHKGKNFDRTPHSSIGSAATGRLHDSDTHKDDMTHRW